MEGCSRGEDRRGGGREIGREDYRLECGEKGGEFGGGYGHGGLGGGGHGGIDSCPTTQSGAVTYSMARKYPRDEELNSDLA